MRTPSLMTYFVGMFQIDQKKIWKSFTGLYDPDAEADET